MTKWIYAEEKKYPGDEGYQHSSAPELSDYHKWVAKKRIQKHIKAENRKWMSKQVTKWFLAIMLLFALLCGKADASEETFDLSSLSYSELVALRDKINLAIWNSQEWQEVEVPQGVWVVGEDIPAGKWTIKAADGVTALVYWGDTLDVAGTALSYNSKIYESEYLYSVNCRYYEKGEATAVTWDLKKGQYFIVEDGIALFTPYSGKPSLGFK